MSSLLQHSTVLSTLHITQYSEFEEDGFSGVYVTLKVWCPTHINCNNCKLTTAATHVQGTSSVKLGLHDRGRCSNRCQPQGL